MAPARNGTIPDHGQPPANGDADAGPSAPTWRVVRILELLSGLGKERRSLSEIARELHLSKATCHAVLMTLVASGYVTRDVVTKSYALGPALIRIGRAAEAAHPVAASASPELARLNEKFGFPTSAVARDGDELVVLDRFPRNNDDDGVVVVIGQRIPLIAPVGEVFLAWAGDEEVEAWIRTGEVEDAGRRQRILEVLAEVRTRRYAVQRVSDRGIQSSLAIARLAEQMPTERSRVLARQLISELDKRDYLDTEMASDCAQPVSVVTAPIRDAEGRVVLSISVWPRGDLTKAQIETIGRALVQASDRLTALL